MKKIFGLVLVVALFVGFKVYADVTLYDNTTQQGRVENIKVKGVTGAVTKSGQTGTIDLTSFKAGNINWADATALKNNSINWTGANIMGKTGINWSDVRALDAQYGSHSGINWVSFGV